MKKYLMIALSILMCFSMFACNNNTPDEGNTPVTPPDTQPGVVFEPRTPKTDGQLYTGGNVTYPNSLWTAPTFEYDSQLDPIGQGNVKAIFIDSPIKYKGKPTKVMGYIGFPQGASASNKVPGIVLVHGGLGTAYPDWVKMWNDRGYAAICIDTEGGQSHPTTNMNTGKHDQKNKYNGHEVYTAGPSNDSKTNPGEDGFWMPGGLTNITNSWMYHATSATILANSLLRSFDSVDTSKVGITGISWGSIITNILVGYDDRYCFAMPVYGSVGINGTAGWLSSYPSVVSKETWDTLEPMKLSTTPIYWVLGNKDDAFGMDGPSKCYLEAKNGFMAIKSGFPHGQTYGAEAGELATFADAVIGKDNQIIKITQNPKKILPTLKFTQGKDVTINSIKLFYTTESTYKIKSLFESIVLTADSNNKVDIVYPVDATYCYVGITYNNNLTASSGLISVKI